MNKLSNVEFKVVGVTFPNNDGSNRQAIISGMDESSDIALVREPGNIYDINAIMVLTGGRQIGYVAKQYAQIMAPMMDAGRLFQAKVEEVDIYNGTWYCRIMVDEV